MRPVEDVAEPVLVVAVAASFGLADPPFDAEGGPLELLGVEGLVEVRRIPPPYEFLVDLAVEGALALGKYLLHMPPIMRYKIRYSDKRRYTQQLNRVNIIASPSFCHSRPGNLGRSTASSLS